MNILLIKYNRKNPYKQELIRNYNGMVKRLERGKPFDSLPLFKTGCWRDETTTAACLTTFNVPD